MPLVVWSSKTVSLEGFREVLRDITICWASRRTSENANFCWSCWVIKNYFMLISQVNVKTLRYHL
ncbi:mCG148285 [Mus musculus]|nr:mCG148285 [Mus musculus]